MSLVLDTGALIALERNERQMWVRLKAAQLADDLPLTHAGVLGQVWRAGPRQARLSQALAGIDVRALDEPMDKEAGRLLVATGIQMWSTQSSSSSPKTATRSSHRTTTTSRDSQPHPAGTSS